MKREVGIKGLDAMIVWHPGWPIDHPRVAQRRAAILWPNPTATDFAALGEVREGECSVVVGGRCDAGRPRAIDGLAAAS